MRVLRVICIVLLFIFGLGGAALGGAGAWSVTIGPMSKKVADISKTVEGVKAIALLTDDAKIVDGKNASETIALVEKGLRAYRFIQIGGAAIALICIALLVFVLRRSSRPLLISAGIGAALAIAAYLIAPDVHIDDVSHDFSWGLAMLMGISAVLAVIADRLGARRAAAPAIR